MKLSNIIILLECYLVYGLIKPLYCLDCFTCDSDVQPDCANIISPQELPKHLKRCNEHTTRCLKAIYDKSETTVLDKDEDDEDAEPVQNYRIVRKCYDRELFSLTLPDDACEVREVHFKEHTFCLCAKDLCNSSARTVASLPVVFYFGGLIYKAMQWLVHYVY